MTLELVQHFGGARFYLPTDDKPRKALRNKAIFDEFKDNNFDALARKYKLSSVQIRNIVQRQSEIQKAISRPGRAKSIAE